MSFIDFFFRIFMIMFTYGSRIGFFVNFPKSETMRILPIILLFALGGCATRIDDSHDPVTKTGYILEAIENKEFIRVQNEYLGIENHPEKRKDIHEAAEEIKALIETYGLPDHNQIKAHSRARWPVAKKHCSEFNGNIVTVVSTDTHFAQLNAPVVHMEFFIVNHDARLLHLGISKPGQ